MLIFGALQHLSQRCYWLGFIHGLLSESAQQPRPWCDSKYAHTHIYAGSVCLSSLGQLIISISSREVAMRQFLITVARQWTPFTSSVCILYSSCQQSFYFCFTSFIYVIIFYASHSFCLFIPLMYLCMTKFCDSIAVNMNFVRRTQDVWSKVFPGSLLH